MPNVDREMLKEATKEAIKEWMDERYAALGRWAVGALMAAAFAGAVYLALRGQGWSFEK